jgi:hypothetical protein
MSRTEQLSEIGRKYVECLGNGDFDSIPYADDVELRAPLCPGGSAVPLIGKKNLKEVWWAPLPDLVSGVELIDTYINNDQTAITAEFLCHIEAMSCTLRIIDRFHVDETGKITAQENFFDPRDVTNPGWSDQTE